MSQIVTNIRGVSGASTWMGQRRSTSNVGVLSTVDTAAAPDYALPQSAVSRSDLLALNAGTDNATRTANALSTANDAIGVIGGLLQNIQTVLTATSDSDTIDPATEQARIDSAVTTIDAIASTARFGSQSLLAGGFSVTGKGGSISLPSFVSADLSTGPVSNTSASDSLASLQSGGANDLASGNELAAGQIVATALSQVALTQSQITGYLSDAADQDRAAVWFPSGAVPDGSQTDDAMYTTAAQMFNEPSLAALAAANSLGKNVLELLWS